MSHEGSGLGLHNTIKLLDHQTVILSWTGVVVMDLPLAQHTAPSTRVYLVRTALQQCPLLQPLSSASGAILLGCMQVESIADATDDIIQANVPQVLAAAESAADALQLAADALQEDVITVLQSALQYKSRAVHAANAISAAWLAAWAVVLALLVGMMLAHMWMLCMHARCHAWNIPGGQGQPPSSNGRTGSSNGGSGSSRSTRSCCGFMHAWLWTAAGTLLLLLLLFQAVAAVLAVAVGGVRHACSVEGGVEYSLVDSLAQKAAQALQV